MLLDLAQNQGDGYVSLKDIAQRQDVSKKYLEQIVPLLNKSNMLRTNRGYQGGYRLSKAPEEYTVGEVLRITEGDLAPVACLQTGVVDCPRAEQCLTISVWEGLYKVVNRYLDSITLQDILNSGPGCGDDYCIYGNTAQRASGRSRSALFQLFQILQKTVLSKAVFSVIIENAAN